ncbi:MAG: hypothetical protein R3F59_38090 [Myxococcota bacterium]
MLFLAASALAAAPVAYTLQPADDGVHFTLRFPGSDAGRTRVALPHAWAGKRDLDDAVRDLRCPDARITGHGPVRVVHHAPGADVTLTWTLAVDDVPDDDEPYYRPVADARGIQLLGPSSLVVPDLDLDEVRPLSLRWEGLPDGWTAADSWGHGPQRDWEGPLSALAAGLIVAGDLDLRILDVDGGQVGVAWLGEPGVDRDALTADVGTLVDAERAAWRSASAGPPWFLVSVLDVRSDAPCCLVGGTGVTHGFATFVDDATSPAMRRRLVHTLAHELFHTWNGIGMAPAAPEERMYWFSEGFTEHGSRRIELDAGVVDPDTYAAEVNEVLAAYAANPYRDRGDRLVQHRFWRDPDAEKLPYQRGELVALRWDTLLRAQGHTLQDVMRDLYARGGPVDADGVLAALRARGVDGAADLAPGPVDVPDDALGPCFAPGLLPGFDPGFDVDATVAATALVGVDPAGPAHTAGLRDGQRLDALSVRYGEPDTPVSLHLVGDDPRTVSYLPQGPPTVPGFVRTAACQSGR